MFHMRDLWILSGTRVDRASTEAEAIPRDRDETDAKRMPYGPPRAAVRQSPDTAAETRRQLVPWG